MQLNSKEYYGTILVCVSAILYGLMAFFGTKLFQLHFAVPNMLFWRFFIAGISMLCRLSPQQTALSTYQIKKIMTGVVCYAVGSGFYFLAAIKIGTGLAMVVFFAYPIIVTLGAYYKNELFITSAKIMALAVIILGLYLLKGRNNAAFHYSGILYGLIAAMGYGLYVFSNRHSARTMNAEYFTCYICMGNALVFLVLAISTHTFFIPTHLIAWCYIIMLAVLTTAIPIQLLLMGMRYIDPIKTSILSVLEPVVTLLIGVLLLHESMSIKQIIGVVIILLSVVIIELDRKKF